MRPLNLIISAFGPYADKTQIPMEKLGSEGLYLITGDTGAGKTTIFDAISFALFGEASGANREASMLRSKYASPDTPTFVELTFSHLGKEYTIKRNPEYLRPAKRGDKLTKELADVEIIMPDGQIVQKKEADTTVTNLLGINKEQFSQIAMLAQGDFLKLLIADTKERQAIFRELFKTGFYQKLQYELEDRRKEIYGKVCDGKKSIELYVAGIEVSEDDVLAIKVEKAKKGQMVTGDILELLDTLIQADLEERKRLDSELKAITKDLEEVNGNIRIAQTLEKTVKELDSSKEKLETEIKKSDEIKEFFKTAKAGLKQKDLLLNDAARLEKELSDIALLDAIKKEIDKEKSNHIKINTKLETQKESLEANKEKATSFKKELDSLKEAGELLQKIKGELDKYKLQQEGIKELILSHKEYLEKQEELKSEQKRYLEEDGKFKKLNLFYEELEQNFRDATAGILALNLREGEACPVCGSTTHPSLARLSDNAPSEEEVKKAREAAKNARDKVNTLATKAASLKEALSLREQTLIKAANKFISIKNIEELGNKLADKANETALLLEETKKKMSEEKSRVDRRLEIETALPKLEAALEKQKNEVTELETNKEKLLSIIKEKEEQLLNQQKRLTFTDKEKANKWLLELKAKIKAISDEYARADATNKEHELLIAGLEAQIKSYEKTVKQTKKIDFEEEKEKKAKLDASQKENIKASRIVASRSNNNSNIKENIERASENILEIEKKLEWVKALSDTANGKLNGKEKIMLETYIQTTYFDHIINRANLRFMQMSGGQYELMRLKESSNNKSQSGLELGVIDHYNGTNRSVKTLSGGESFMAALSLALGLSEEVQSEAGGIQIDTMFVDEGFGSLDPEALSQAYKALTGLTEGNRLVGIISHVADLKERIDKQIVVKKGKSGGSYINMVD